MFVPLPWSISPVKKIKIKIIE
jgi:hypothetical protein